MSVEHTQDISRESLSLSPLTPVGNFKVPIPKTWLLKTRLVGGERMSYRV